MTKKCPEWVRRRAQAEGVTLSEMGRRGALVAARRRAERRQTAVIFEEEDETYTQGEMFSTRRAH